MTDNEPSDLNFGVLASNVGIQVNLTRRALWMKPAAARRKGMPRRPSGYYSVLIMIGANPGASQKRLADELFLDAGALGDIVDLLEAGGLVERRRDLTDRRRMSLYLTEAGEAACDEARRASEAQDQIVTMDLNNEEQAQLISLLRRLRE